MENLNSVKIYICRAKRSIWSTRTLKIFIDDRKAGKLYNGEEKHFSVTPGRHSVYIKVGRAKSETLNIKAGVGEKIYFECGAKEINLENIQGLKDIRSTFRSLKDTLYFKEVDNQMFSVLIDDITTKIAKNKFYIFSKRFLIYFTLTMWILGLFGFTQGFLTAAGWAFWVTSGTNLPLGDLSGVAVDNNNNIYCVANFYYRIQKYAPNGSFLKGWPSLDNNPRIKINEHDQLEVANDKRTRKEDHPDSLSTYDSEGNLISEKIVDGCYKQFGEECEKMCHTKSGDAYLIKNKWLWPHIVKTTPSGISETVVTTPWYRWLLLGPFPAWIFFAVGLFSFWKVVDRM